MFYGLLLNYQLNEFVRRRPLKLRSGSVTSTKTAYKNASLRHLSYGSGLRPEQPANGHTCRKRGDGHMTHKSKSLPALSVILFSSLSILSLWLRFLLKCILSHASLAHSVAPGVPSSSYADVCVVTPVSSRRPHPPKPSPYNPLLWDDGCAVPGSPWQPWDGASEAITAVL